MRTLCFCPVVSCFFFLLLFSTPNLSGRRTQKWRKNRRLSTIVQICRAVSSQRKHISTIAKKLLNSNMSCTCLRNMANFGPPTAEIGSGVWGTPANFNGFRVLASLLQRRRSPEANQTLHNVWPSSCLVHCVYTVSYTHLTLLTIYSV